MPVREERHRLLMIGKKSCTFRSMAKGNLVDWTTAKFDVINMTASTQTTRSVCIPPRPGDIIFPEKRNFTAHQVTNGDNIM